MRVSPGALTSLIQRSACPPAWSERAVGELAKVVGGATPDRSDASYWIGGTLLWATPTDITACDGKWLSDTAEKITQKGLAECSTCLLPPGTILYTSRATIGAKAIATQPTATNQGFANFIAKPGVNADFLYYLLDALTPVFIRLGAGTTFLEVTKRDIRKVRCFVPPPAEQAGIARILDAADAAIARTRTGIEKARRVKSALLQRLLSEGAPLPSEANRKLASSRFGRFPKDWSVERLSAVAEVGSGVTLGKDLTGFKTIDLPYLRVANVQDGHLNLSEIKRVRVRVEEVDRYLLQAGDVVMTEGGDIDKLGRGAIWPGTIAPCLHQNHIFRVRANRDRLVPEYFAAVIGSDFGKRYFMRIAKRTTNLASINKTQLRAFTLPIPPVDEQQRIVALIAKADAQSSASEIGLDCSERIKAGLLQDLLTGRVRVPVKESKPTAQLQMFAAAGGGA